MTLISRLKNGVSAAASGFFGGTGQPFTSWFGGWVRHIRPTQAGTKVDEEIALGVSAVWGCTSLLADAVSSLPINVVKVEGITTTIQETHPAQQLLNRGANSDMSTMQVLNVAMVHLGIWSNAFIEVVRDSRNNPRFLYPVLPSQCQPIMATGLPYDIIEYYQVTSGGMTRRVDPEDMIHIKGHSVYGFTGYPLINAMRESIGLALAQEGFGARYFRNDAKSGGFISVPNAKVSPASKKALQESMSSGGEDDDGTGMGGLDNAHKIKVLEGGAKYIPVTISPNDSQFLESRGFQIAEVCRFYRVPLVKMDSSAATAWGSGIEQLEIGFVTDTIIPLTRRVEDELTRKLLTEKDQNAGVKIKINVGARIRGDMNARANYAASSITNGWQTRNEVRAAEGLNPLPGLDEPLVPLNMQTIKESETNANDPDPLAS